MHVLVTWLVPFIARKILDKFYQSVSSAALRMILDFKETIPLGKNDLHARHEIKLLQKNFEL